MNREEILKNNRQMFTDLIEKENKTQEDIEMLKSLFEMDIIDLMGNITKEGVECLYH